MVRRDSNVFLRVTGYPTVDMGGCAATGLLLACSGIDDRSNAPTSQSGDSSKGLTFYATNQNPAGWRGFLFEWAFLILCDRTI